jgi:hypothetical protein
MAGLTLRSLARMTGVYATGEISVSDVVWRRSAMQETAQARQAQLASFACPGALQRGEYHGRKLTVVSGRASLARPDRSRAVLPQALGKRRTHIWRQSGQQVIQGQPFDSFLGR